ncbi:HNH endonuclease, partial [Candidatus Saccharibacteria bacterium]|nr:HNH endonuclease [Candidatus Saccharibacteria bacterium]
SSSNLRPRAISEETKNTVYIRDGGQCTYVSNSGTRCTCTKALQYDHTIPVAKGGSSSASNIRLMCQAHNLLLAEQEFGKQKVKKEIERRRAS